MKPGESQTFRNPYFFYLYNREKDVKVFENRNEDPVSFNTDEFDFDLTVTRKLKPIADGVLYADKSLTEIYTKRDGLWYSTQNLGKVKYTGSSYWVAAPAMDDFLARENLKPLIQIDEDLSDGVPK